MRVFGGKAFLKIAALATVGMGTSGCVYDVGLGYASDGYYDDAYDCDPYGGYDNYYRCDYGHGFNNIGYGGGWYDNYWYPGYGFYLFDNYGGRYPMRDSHRRYWGEQRHNWYRQNRGRHRDGGRHQGRGRGYTDNAAPDGIGWPERNGGRMRDGDDNRRGRGEGQGQNRRGRNDQWRGGQVPGPGVDAVPAPNPNMEPRAGRGGQRGEGFGRPNRRGDDMNAIPMPQPQQPDMREGGREERMRGSGEGRRFRQLPPQAESPQSAPPAPRAAPPSQPTERVEPVERLAPPQREIREERVPEQ